jgi:hypothetical protein
MVYLYSITLVYKYSARRTERAKQQKIHHIHHHRHFVEELRGVTGGGFENKCTTGW